MAEPEPAGVPDEAAGIASLVRLLTWTSPAFPVGAFAFSHGLEAAIAEGRVRDGEALFGWIETLLLHGSGWNDLVFLTQAHRLASRGETGPDWDDLLALARASAGSAERRREVMDLGRAFAEAAAPWAEPPLPGETPVPYTLAFGTLAAREGVPLLPSLAAFAHGFAANLASVAVRLVPLGQREAVRVIRRLEPVFDRAARRASASTLDDLGSAAILSDIAALRHETLQPRLFLT